MDAREKEIHVELGQEIERLYNQLLSKRAESNWEAKLTACSYLHHRDNYKETRVPKRTTHDTSARQYFNTFRDGMAGYIMPSDSTWARLLPLGDVNESSTLSYTEVDQKSQMWVLLEKMNRAVMQEFAVSNFYVEVKEVLTDAYLTGTGYMLVLEREEDANAPVYYKCIDPQEAVIAENQYHEVDVFVRKMDVEAIDLIRMFPNAELEHVREAVRKGGGDMVRFTYIEAVLPSDYLYSHRTEEPFNIGKGKKFAHVVYIPEERELVQDKGCDEFFIYAYRYNKENDKSPYGTGLAESVLDDIIKTDNYACNVMKTGQRIADPPVVITPALKGKFSARPASIIVTPDMTQAPQVLDFTSGNYSYFISLYQAEKENLRSLFKADLFTTVMSSTDSRKTAYEVSERKNEALTLLALCIEDLNRELISPIYKRTLKYIIRRKARESLERQLKEFGKIDEFVDKHLEVTLDSVFVRRLQNYLNTQGLVAGITNVATVFQIAPETTVNFNWNDIIRKLAVGSGLEAEDLVSYSTVQQQQKAMAQAQAAQAQAERGQLEAKANLDNSKAATELGYTGDELMELMQAGGAQQ